MPIKKIVHVLIVFNVLIYSLDVKARGATKQQRPFSIMLSPAGDAQHTGRQLTQIFERGITLQYAEQLKKALESQIPSIKVLLTHSSGERVRELQSANFANRLNVDLYVSIHFYQERGIKPCLHLYSFSYGNDFAQKWNPLRFYSYDQVHLYNKTQTRAWGTKLKNSLSKQKLFNVYGLHKLPFKPLMGIKAPAIGLEISLKHKDDWQQYIQPVVQGLKSIIASQTF